MSFSQKLKIILQSKYFIFISLFLALLYVFITTKVIVYDTKYSLDTNILTGNVVSYTIDGNKLNMLIKAREKVQVTYYINSLEEKEYLQKELLIGQKVVLEGKITRPYQNTIPNTFNYQKYLYNNRIYVTFSADKITLEGKTNFLNKIKSDFMKRIDGVGSSKAYLYALILGEVDYIDGDVYQDYQKNGTTHLFAVSGMHISALVLFLTSFFKKIRVPLFLTNIIIVLFLFFYMFLIGFTPSVIRGALLFIFLLLNRKLKLHLKTVNVLYILFLILIIINPFYIYNLGFIYSFLTSFGLILFSKKIKGNYIQKLIKVSSIAFLFSFPITVYNFYEINLLTIINNVIIVPFVTIILFPLTLITFLFPFLDPLLNIGIIFLENISHFLNYFQINLVVPKVNFLFFILYYIGVYFIYKGKWKTIFYLIFLVISVKILPFLNSNTYVYFLDVGQGDSTLIVGSHGNYAMLIDTGGKIKFEQEDWEVRNKEYDGASNIITFLKSLGITKLDLLVGTHGDADHMGEAINLVNNFVVDKVVFNKGSYNDLEKSLIQVLEKKNIPYFQNLSEINLGNNKFYFLNDKEFSDENNNSLVMYTNMEGFKFLFMGDAGVEVENYLREKYNLLNIDVLKVGHHGSKTSSSLEFINWISPIYAIISVGRNNRYGHPNMEVLKNLDNSFIYRTDLNGSISFILNKENISIKTYEP